MKKKIISTFLISLVILSLSAVSIFADNNYIWVGTVEWANKSSNNVITVSRMLREYDDVNYFVIRGPVNSSVIFYGPMFDTADGRNNWVNQRQFSYINSISNGNLGSTSTATSSSQWTQIAVNYKDNNVTRTCYSAYYQAGFNWYFYGRIGKTYALFETEQTGNLNNNNKINKLVCYMHTGLYSTNNISDDFVAVQLNRYFPYVFGSSNTEGDQRNYDPETSNINTINIHPEDSFNTYQVNRNTASTTVDFDTYVLPDAIDINSNVLTNTELRYEDVTNNTEISVSNVTNYYTGGGEGNDNNTGDNGGNGSVNNAGVTFNVSENAVNMTQTIEENAVNVTVNNNQNVSQDVANNINQIVNSTNPNGNTFQQTVQNLSEFIAIGNTFSQIAASYLSFMPPYVVTLLGITMALVMFMIVLRIIHLFI